MKRFFALFLTVILCVGITSACNKPQNLPTDPLNVLGSTVTDSDRSDLSTDQSATNTQLNTETGTTDTGDSASATETNPATSTQTQTTDSNPDASSDAGNTETSASTSTGTDSSTETSTSTKDSSTSTSTKTSSTSTSTKGTSSTSAATSTPGTEDSGTPEQPVGYDPSMEHKLILGDVNIPGIIVLDLNKCTSANWSDLKDSKALVWEWNPRTSSGCSYWSINGMSDAKYRWSEYYQKYVVIACNSRGWVGIIDYNTKATLWQVTNETDVHSVEMMPNGDLVVICSGGSNIENGYVRYFPLSQNNGAKTYSSTYAFKSGHGVCWDPERNILWALGWDGVRGYIVRDYGTTNAQLVHIKSINFPSQDINGHDLSPVYGQPGKYWITANSYIWQFDAATETMTRSYSNYGTVTGAAAKGVANFEDGTVVVSRPDGTGNQTWLTTNLYITKVNSTGTATKTTVSFAGTGRQFYKVHTFSADYQ